MDDADHRVTVSWNDAEFGETAVGAAVARPGYGGIVLGPNASLQFDPTPLARCRPRMAARRCGRGPAGSVPPTRRSKRLFGGNCSDSILFVSGGTESSQTLRWRGVDSNFQYAEAVKLVVPFSCADCLGRVGVLRFSSFFIVIDRLGQDRGRLRGLQGNLVQCPSSGLGGAFLNLVTSAHIARYAVRVFCSKGRQSESSLIRAASALYE
jgi:hypothetical protein